MQKFCSPIPRLTLICLILFLVACGGGGGGGGGDGDGDGDGSIPNNGPVANADTVSTIPNAAITIDVLANDTDLDTSDVLTVTAVDTTGTLGSVTNNGTDVSYDPGTAYDSLAVGESATDTFTYTISDGNGGTDTATVSVTITVSEAAPAGIYEGTVTPDGGSAETAIGLITSDNRVAMVAMVNILTEDLFIGTISENNLSGTLHMDPADGAPATGQVTSVSGNNISGTFSSSIGEATFALVADPDLYNRGMSFAKLTGVWVDGAVTLTIQADGSFLQQSASVLGCPDFSGQFSLIDPSKNEFGMSATITACGSFDGPYSGIGIMNDTTFPDDTLVFAYDDGVNYVYLRPIRQ